MHFSHSFVISVAYHLTPSTSGGGCFYPLQSLPDVSQALGAEAPKSTLIDSVTRLLQDPEADVRLAILKGIGSSNGSAYAVCCLCFFTFLVMALFSIQSFQDLFQFLDPRNLPQHFCHACKRL